MIFRFYFGAIGGFAIKELICHKIKKYINKYKNIDSELPESDKIVNHIDKEVNDSLTTQGGGFLSKLIKSRRNPNIQLTKLPVMVIAIFQNKVIQSLVSMYLGASVTVGFQEVALICSESCPVSVGGTELAQRAGKYIVQSELLIALMCELEKIINDDNILGSKKNKIIGTIDIDNLIKKRNLEI